MNAHVIHLHRALRDIDRGIIDPQIDDEMAAEQARLAEEDRAASEIAAGLLVISPGMREALEGLAAVLDVSDREWCSHWDGDVCWAPQVGKNCACGASSIRPASHAHAQSNLLTRRAAIAAERRFAPEPVVVLSGFGVLDHAASMRATGEWEAEAEEVARERAAGFPYGEVDHD